MDTKIAKQAANTNRRGFRGPREISTDSGISSIGAYYSTTDNAIGELSPSRRACSAAKNKPRNFEMIINGRHKFDVRELDDSLSDESIAPLSLPQLPSVFSSGSQPAPLSGLSRNNTFLADSTTAEDDSTASLNYNRKSSLTSLDVDSIEEEKEFRDKSTSEKSSRNVILKEYSPSSKTSSPVSSRASWCNAGETMAFKDCSSMSVSSCDSVNQKDKTLSLDVGAEGGLDSVDDAFSGSALKSGRTFLCKYIFPLVRSKRKLLMFIEFFCF